MSIEPFKIINADGSTNQAEYERCIKFLNDYKDGKIPVYPTVTWENPYEVDMSRDESALEILSRCILYDSNRLLTKSAFNDIKKLFTGILERYGSTIHTCGKYLEASANFTDGPGYMYDVFNFDEDVEVKAHELNSDITIYYLNDDNHTVLEYSDTAYKNSCVIIPTSNDPSMTTGLVLNSNVDSYPDVYKGNLSGLYTPFQRLTGQYIGSPVLFYYSECNDQLYTTGGKSYKDDRVEEIINFNYGTNVQSKSKPARGISLTDITAAQQGIVNSNNANAYIPPTLTNKQVPYITPTFFTANDATEWLI